jgi:hypothetical protein
VHPGIGSHDYQGNGFDFSVAADYFDPYLHTSRSKGFGKQSFHIVLG